LDGIATTPLSFKRCAPFIRFMETDTLSYYFLKGLAITFSIVFTGGSIIGLVFPESMTITHNDRIVETNFLNILPFLMLGLISTYIASWIVRNFFRVKMDENGITIKTRKNAKYIDWHEINEINVVDWLWKGSIFKVQPKEGYTFYFHSDRPTLSFSNFMSSEFETKMADFVKKKKEELGI
jgi:hypothetical protein